jgi:hypothetical protein
MQFQPHDVPETLATHSRRSLWAAISFILVAGGAAVSLAISPGVQKATTSLFTLLPIAIACAVLALRKGGQVAAGNPELLRTLQDDELRQHSLRIAYRNGLFAALAVQPFMAFGLTSFAAAYPLAVMAAATVTIGSTVMLASLLVYDR